MVTNCSVNMICFIDKKNMPLLVSRLWICLQQIHWILYSHWALAYTIIKLVLYNAYDVKKNAKKRDTSTCLALSRSLSLSLSLSFVCLFWWWISQCWYSIKQVNADCIVWKLKDAYLRKYGIQNIKLLKDMFEKWNDVL